MKKLKRLLSLCLILTLVLGQIPTTLHTAYAAETAETTETASTDETAETDAPTVTDAPTPTAETTPIVGVTPVGTTIDLFDYWVNPDNHNDIIKYPDTYKDSGINSHGPLKFWYTGKGEAKQSINLWTGYHGDIFRNIVQDKLGDDNYPVLANGLDTGLGSTTDGTESLAYLFNDEDIEGKTSYTDVHGLFQVDENGYYSFNSDQTGAQLHTEDPASPDYKSFKLVDFNDDVRPLDKGFFPFNQVSAAGFLDEDGNVIYNQAMGIKEDERINHLFGAHMTTQFVQSEDGKTDDGLHVTYDFVGDDDVWIFIDGILVGDVGGIHNPATVNIDFADGDITYMLTDTNTNKLYDAPADHNSDLLTQYEKALGQNAIKYYNRTENFTSKEISDEPTTDPEKANIAKVKNGANTHIFQKTNDNKWIFADGTYHTLDFFFLERGAGGSNMNLKFNLEEIPPTYIHKVDQDGNPIAGVEFDLYVVQPQNDAAGKAFTEWTTGEPTEKVVDYPVATGITDEDGMLTLCYSENMGSKAGKMASLADIFSSYQPYTVKKVVSSGGLEYENALLLELRESERSHDGVLANYRHAEATSLRLENINGTYILRSNDRWNNGVYATPMAVISAPKKIQSVDIKLAPESKARETFEFDLSNPEYEGAVGLFAVVLAWVGDEPPTSATIVDEANWGPVYGSPETGWTIEKLDLNNYLDSEGKPDYAKALGAAIGRYAQEHTAEGSFIYSFNASPAGSYDAEIANLPGEIDHYYFMMADSYGNIADTNHNGSTDDELAKVKYTTTFYFSKAGSPEDMTGDQTYRINHRDSNFQRKFGATIGVPNIENRLMVQRLDAQGNTVCAAGFALYAKEAVDETTLTLKPDAEPVFEAQPTANLEQKPGGAHVTMGGGAAFHGLPAGVYYLQETDAPVGYASNDKLIKVIVDDKGVHAYAGDPRPVAAGESNIDDTKGIPFGDGDGVSVLVGVGRLVSTMSNFGSNGMIDTTLTDIYALRATGTLDETTGELIWQQVDTNDKPYLQRKWRTYDTHAAMQYLTANPEKDIIGNPNPLADLENPYGYVSASGWNWDLVTQNYYGIYDPGMRYAKLLEELQGDSEKLAAIEAATRTKTALPTHEDYKPEDANQFNISDGYTSFGNKILNGLFSGSTTVRVASTAVGDLVISKNVAKADGVDALPDVQTFPFALSFTYKAPTIADNIQGRPINTIGDIDMTPTLSGDYDYTVTKDGAPDETGTLTITKDAAGDNYHVTSLTTDAGTDAARFADGKIQLADDETITIKALPRGATYTVAEDKLDHYTQTVTATTAVDANVDPRNREAQQPAQPVKQGARTVQNTIAVPGQIDTLVYSNLYYAYAPDDSGDSGDDNENDANTPSDLNTTDHTAYVIGYPDGNVRPGGSITRAEAATVFFRLLTDEARAKYWRQTNAYNDVPADMWCNNAISTLSNMGIICGDPDGAFRPNDPITRAELAKISVGFFDTKGLVQSAQTYADVPTGEWYARYVAAADLLKLVEGYPDKTFRPNNKITRAETCTMVNRILGRAPHADHLLAEDAMLTWPDNPKQAWYYTQIQEATNSHDYRWIRVDGKRVDEWTAKLKERSWADLEKQWSDAYDAPGRNVTGD